MSNQEGDSSSSSSPQQPRQPHNMQGLLRFAMEATRSEDAPADDASSRFKLLDDEQRRFLETALNSMTVDVIDVLRKQIDLLQNVSDLPLDADVKRHVDAIDTIVDYVDNIDVANDFHKIGGFTIFRRCFACVHPEVRAGACDVLGVLAENNPLCQRVVMDNDLLPALLDLLNTDTDDGVCVKATYAVSCVTRCNASCYARFVQLDGPVALRLAFDKPNDRLRIKTAFLLSCLCDERDDLPARLVSLRYVPSLIAVVSQERRPSHEHVLRLLTLLAEGDEDAADECADERYRLSDALSFHVRNVPAECTDEVDYCRRLQRVLTDVRK